MKTRYLIMGALFVFWLVFMALMTRPAQAQTVCGERKVIMLSLEKTFSEAPVSMGLASNGAMIEVFASSSGSFTILLTRPDGVSCVMAAGENWENLPKKLIGGAKI